MTLIRSLVIALAVLVPATFTLAHAEDAPAKADKKADKAEKKAEKKADKAEKKTADKK